ncbi:Protein arginine N-methyltransferase 1.5 [Galdieria sulphuraria]|nr:Protein arginine N-methyltransferase 1.5 [Galdieria sulphuraria]
MVIVHPTNGTYLYVGLEFDIVSDIKACLNLVETTGFDFFLIPLAKPRQSSKNEDNGVISNILDFEPSVSSDLELSGNTWNSVVLDLKIISINNFHGHSTLVFGQVLLSWMAN